MIVPDPRAARRRGRAGRAGASTLRDWTDGDDPYAATAPLLDPTGRYAISDSAWAMHVLGLQAALPESSYVSMTQRAADAARDQGRRRARAAGRGRRGRRRDASRRSSRCASPGARETEVGRRPRRAAAQARALAGRLHRRRLRARTAPTRTTRPASGSIEEGDMVVLDFGGLKDGYGSDTTRTVHVGEPTDEEREVHDIVRARPAGRLRGRAPGRRLPGDRPRRAHGDHRRRLRRVLHPPRRPRHRPHHSRAAVHGRGREAAARARACASRSSPASTCPGRFGVRIEDIVVVTEDGGRRLNTPPTRCASSHERGHAMTDEIRQA